MKKENYTILSKTESLSSAVSGFWLAYRVCLTILLRVRVGYDISYPTSGSVKTTDWQLVLNFEQTRTVTIFRGHGIMAHIPWWLSQSEL